MATRKRCFACKWAGIILSNLLHLTFSCGAFAAVLWTGKLYSQLRVLHLAGAKAEDLMDCVIYPGLVQIQKQR